MALLSSPAIQILRELAAAPPGGVPRPDSWPWRAWYELSAAGLVAEAHARLPGRSSWGERQRERRRTEARIAGLAAAERPPRVWITERGRERLARIEAGRRGRKSA